MWGTAEKRYVGHVCLRNPFPLFLLGIPSIHSLPEAGFWEPQYVPPGLHYGCIMPIPSLQLQKKNLSHAGKQSGRGVVVSKICYNALIVLSIVLCDCCKPMNTCRDPAFSNSGLEAGLPAFQLPMFVKCDALLKRKSKHPLPARSRFLRAAVRSTSSASWLHYACKSSHPFVEDSGFVAHAEKHRSGQCRGLQGLLGNIAMSNVFFFPICRVDYWNALRLSF